MESESQISKSQRKRDMHALQALGKTLVELPQDQLARIDLPEALRAAVLEARRISARGASRRQLQYVGRLMRDVDAGHIREQLEHVQARSAKSVAVLHRAERWREQLLADPDCMSQFVSEFPGADVQRLRTLLRNAQREIAGSKPPRAFRELLRDIRETLLKHDRAEQSNA